MAQTFNIACYNCKVTLWIGQRSGSTVESGRIYNSWQAQNRLRDFLYSHVGHPLVFIESEALDVIDYEDLSDYGDES